MEFYHLRSFVAVAQTGNLTQAAKRLYTTPPAISAHIKALEDELVTPLFIRSNKGMTLTDKGKLLLTKAQITLDSAVDLVNLATNNQHEVIGLFNLANNLTPSQIKLDILNKNLTENCPGINIEIHQQSTGKTLTDLRDSTIDGGYIFGDIPDDMQGITVSQQAITTIAPNSFALSQHATLAELKKHAWITMGNNCPFDSLLQQKLGDNITTHFQSSDDNTRLNLVTNQIGLSFLDKTEAQAATQNHNIDIINTLDFSIPLHFVVMKNRHNEPLINAVLQEIRILWDITL